MYFLIIDCGTTNSRAYLVDISGSVISSAEERVGVKNVAETGDKGALLAGLRRIASQAASLSGVCRSEIGAVLSSGMITSEIGLIEIPHLIAPCGLDELARGLKRADEIEILQGAPSYFVPGIKNRAAADGSVGEMDFMRGEETQLMGLIARNGAKLPLVAVGLSSHTKFMPIDEAGRVSGSVTTMSGQLYEAVIEHTFVGKSVKKRENDIPKPYDYFDRRIIDEASECVDRAGLLRVLMFPRFMDVLSETAWYERELFLDAAIAAEDMKALRGANLPALNARAVYRLIGSPERARLYGYLLQKYFPGLDAKRVEDIPSLAITGSLAIAARAGIIG